MMILMIVKLTTTRTKQQRRCSNCGKIGHTKRVCTEPQREKNNNTKKENNDKEKNDNTKEDNEDHSDSYYGQKPAAKL